MGFRQFPARGPPACPGCAHHLPTVFSAARNTFEDDLRRNMRAGVTNIPVSRSAVPSNGCIAMASGESKTRDMALSLSRNPREPAAPIFIEWQETAHLRVPIAPKISSMRRRYIEKRFVKPLIKLTASVFPTH